MAWVERASPSFTARFDERDADDAARVLDQLEQAREDFSGRFPRAASELTAVIHDSELALALAAPYLPLARVVTAPAGRRYLAGWFGAAELHMLAPRLLARRASAVPGPPPPPLLTPRAPLPGAVGGAHNPDRPPPFPPAPLLPPPRGAALAGAGGAGGQHPGVQKPRPRGRHAGGGDHHVARPRRQVVGHVEAPRAPQQRGHALLEQQPLDELRLGLVAPAGHPHQVAIGELRLDLAGAFVAVGDRRLHALGAGVYERHPALGAEALVQRMRGGAGRARERLAHASTSSSISSTRLRLEISKIRTSGVSEATPTI